MRKQLDPRIAALITNGVAANHRSFFVLVGDRGRDQVVNLHYLLSQARNSARPNVLWCYKKELGFTTHRKKREAKIKKDIKRGIREANDQDPFELFITVTDIKYTYYKDSSKILGQTFGMLVLQDYEAITPNLLARTIETVEGGGIVVLLLRTMTSLKQLYAMAMDVHSRYRTDAHQYVKPRFNERFILSLGSCQDCLVLDDELNVLPLSKGKDIDTGRSGEDDRGKKRRREELEQEQARFESGTIVGPLAKLTATVDQAKAVSALVEKIARKSPMSHVVPLTAGRGRGKSAALGLAIGAAVAYGYSNIFVTSPDPENLKTLFEFVFKALEKLGYKELVHYQIRQSENPEFKKAIVRVDITRDHRQTIQYIAPEDSQVLGQAELVIIDEAAAIPLPLVRKLIGPYLVFMASTINGYEGTGRSLSLKLFKELREKRLMDKPDGVKLDEPVRYSLGDNVEKWLNDLLCLDATTLPRATHGCPHPSQCELYYVNRDTLFSYHPASEVFLQRMMALYVASHYKNSPNDLQMLSDAPAHHLFVLLPPIKEDSNTLPDPLVVLQVALEGNISKEAIGRELSSAAAKSSGDMIPWVISQQFQDGDFATLSGARVVRIATHPEFFGMGYGRRAIEALNSFYSGELYNFEDAAQNNDDEASANPSARISKNATLQSDEIGVRDVAKMPPLLQRLSERKPEALDYLGVSFGMTQELLKFWKKLGFMPLYASQKENALTGEHTFVMLRGLLNNAAQSEGWLSAFAQDFRHRFMNLLGYDCFKKFHPSTALSIIEACSPKSASSSSGQAASSSRQVSADEINALFTPFDFKRLDSYASGMQEYHLISDLVPTLSDLFFSRRLGDLSLSALQQFILLALGLQRKNIDTIETELQATSSQALALFQKTIRRLLTHLESIREEGVRRELPMEQTEAATKAQKILKGADGEARFQALQQTAEEELSEEAKRQRTMQRELLNIIDMSQYAIDESADFSTAQKQVEALANATPEARAKLSTTISVKTAAPQAGTAANGKKAPSDKQKNGHAGKNGKNRRESEGGDRAKKRVKA